MNADFRRWMADATRLAQGGPLQDATAAIQAALSQAGLIAPSAAAADDGLVIDVTAREVASDGHPAKPAVADEPGGGGDSFTAGRHAEKAGARDYKLYLPPAAAHPCPLVVMLHGCTQNPDDFAAGTRMNEAARERGIAVLYPAQAQQANPQLCWNWFKHNHQQRGRGEPAILAGMVGEVVRRHGLDERRVYVAGLSAGGAMAAILGDAYPDLFAAVGVHSGLATGAARDAGSAFAAMKSGAPGATAVGAAGVARTGKPPTIVFHGDQDSTVNPVNGEQVARAGLPAAGPTRAETLAAAGGRSALRSTYQDAGGRVAAEHWLIHGAGHAWSGGSRRGSYADPQGPDASAEMLRFFSEHPLSERY